MRFLSERNLSLHKEYLRNLERKYSIFEKSYPSLVGKGLRGVARAKVERGEREEAFLLRAEIEAHRLFFSSFSDCSGRCEAVCKKYGSEASFLYELMRASSEREGFLLVFRGERGVEYYAGREYGKIFMRYNPLLAIDLCEHSYFLDYLFDKRTYMKNALSRLNLAKITKDIAK